MRLVDLNPAWLPSYFGERGEAAPARRGVGIRFDCPVCAREGRPRGDVFVATPGARGDVFVVFENPLDGGPPAGSVGWRRTGETFETLTLSPSIDAGRNDHGTHKGWHGHVVSGEIVGGV